MPFHQLAPSVVEEAVQWAEGMIKRRRKRGGEEKKRYGEEEEKEVGMWEGGREKWRKRGREGGSHFLASFASLKP